ncbi:uncharacterized protein LOC120273221 [Dioscorea cayenensis subsp. rotundata]|uniref:Uncharacterized protein LOC120273221 n=1 Tax=Dioscorea cayennensis subsp. rotundata TaxID=55577 RepID=A0AB40C7I8_DIOCR|nr:uncharacterized protein LOC120273221 [Dioscorea cayenensis subsp. rotundata]
MVMEMSEGRILDCCPSFSLFSFSFPSLSISLSLLLSFLTFFCRLEIILNQRCLLLLFFSINEHGEQRGHGYSIKHRQHNTFVPVPLSLDHVVGLALNDVQFMLEKERWHHTSLIILALGPRGNSSFLWSLFRMGRGVSKMHKRVSVDLRSSILKQMADVGIKYIMSNTFSYYD